MKRLFVDCSFLVQNPQIRTGIQRVVRRLVDEMPKVITDYPLQIIPVRLDSGRILPIQATDLQYENPSSPVIHASALPGASPKLRRWVREYCMGVASAGLNLFLMLLPTLRSRQLALDALRKARRGYRALRASIIGHGSSGLVKQALNSNSHGFTPCEQDCLLMLDSSWHLALDESLAIFKQTKAKVVYVVYDLIPILYPQFCDQGLIPIFDRWIRNTSQYADGYLCISNAVKHDVEQFMLEHAPERAGQFTYGSFPLGCDFVPESTATASQQAAEPLPHSLQGAFKDSPCFLMVSTIEPRKNHRMVLEAFDRLWKRGVKVNLLIVGKVGWNVQSLMLRIKSHPQLNKQLFMLNNADDSAVRLCYANSTALVFASFTEGFGLPIVEALAAGLPVIASDIACHREVGGKLIHYFDLNRPETLDREVLNMLGQSNQIKASLPAKVQENGVVVSWHQSAQQAIQFCRSLGN